MHMLRQGKGACGKIEGVVHLGTLLFGSWTTEDVEAKNVSRYQAAIKIAWGLPTISSSIALIFSTAVDILGLVDRLARQM